MKNAILIFLAGILPVNGIFAQETYSFPRWLCSHNSLITSERRAVDTEEGFSCWAECEVSEPNPLTPLGHERIHACVDQVLTDSIGLDSIACEESLGIPRQCLPPSSGGGSNNTKALIAGGAAVAAVVVVKYLAPDLPEGVNVRPEANIAYRDGLAMSTAGIVGGWRNWEFSAVSANTGNGWTKPYARVQWSWVF